MKNYELINVEFQYHEYPDFDNYKFRFYSYGIGVVEFSNIEISAFGTPERVNYHVDCHEYGEFYIFPVDIPDWDNTEIETDAGTFPAGLWQTIAEWLTEQI